MRVKMRSTIPSVALRGGHERADLRQDHEQRGLAQIRRFAAHVGTGQHDEAVVAFVQVHVVGNERRAEQRFDDRMAAVDDVDRGVFDERRPHVRPLRCDLRERRERVDVRERVGGREQVVDALREPFEQRGEEVGFRAAAGAPARRRSRHRVRAAPGVT